MDKTPRKPLPPGIAKVLKRPHSPLDVILLWVRWYVACSLSLRNFEEMTAERGFVKAAARANNRAENSHQSTREREPHLRGFSDPKRTRVFLPSFGPIRRHFAFKQHLLRASLYRKQLAQRFDAWHRFTELTLNPSTARANTRPL